LGANGDYTYVVNEGDSAVQALRTAGQTVTDTFTYTVKDTAGLTDDGQLVVTIHGANDAPVAVDDTTDAIEAGGTNNTAPGSNGTGNVLANDTDVDSTANGETKAVSAVDGVTASVGAGVVGAHGTLTLGA